jgi:hypothetical protein
MHIKSPKLQRYLALICFFSAAVSLSWSGVVTPESSPKEVSSLGPPPHLIFLIFCSVFFFLIWKYRSFQRRQTALLQHLKSNHTTAEREETHPT